MCKILGAGGRRKGAGGIQKTEIRAGAVGDRWPVATDRSPTCCRRLLVASGRATAGRSATSGRQEVDRGPQWVATSGRPLVAGRRLDSWAQSFFFGFFWILFFKSFLRPLHVARAWAS
jgi:hypothetical protein